MLRTTGRVNFDDESILSTTKPVCCSLGCRVTVPRATSLAPFHLLILS